MYRQTRRFVSYLKGFDDLNCGLIKGSQCPYFSESGNRRKSGNLREEFNGEFGDCHAMIPGGFSVQTNPKRI